MTSLCSYKSYQNSSKPVELSCSQTGRRTRTHTSSAKNITPLVEVKHIYYNYDSLDA